jgi:nucleotide-binding universal stress UspA family protein
MDHTFRILHPTDLREAGRTAFLHALKIAVALRGKLTVLHVKREGEEVGWDDLPGVRGTLHRWGLLPANADGGQVAALGLAVRKVIAKDDDPVRACLEHLAGHPADLMVLATSQHQGRARWLDRAVSEPLAREAGLPALLVPQNAPGFVRDADGSLDLDRVLVPVAPEPRPARAAAFAARLLEGLGFTGVIDVVHVGDHATMPAFDAPASAGMVWERRAMPGEVEPTLVRESGTSGLVVMPTQGHHGFLDVLRGSTTERVLRNATCPVLAFPAA